MGTQVASKPAYISSEAHGTGTHTRDINRGRKSVIITVSVTLYNYIYDITSA